MTTRLPAEQRRRQLLDVACTVFATHGFHATSMDDVASAAGVTKPVLYQHFPSKRALFVELLENVGHELLGLLAEATRNARATAQQFASDAGARVGRIRSANQGMIQIFGSDGFDESGAFSPTSAPVKKIRVVSTFEFELE